MEMSNNNNVSTTHFAIFIIAFYMLLYLWTMNFYHFSFELKLDKSHFFFTSGIMA